MLIFGATIMVMNSITWVCLAAANIWSCISGQIYLGTWAPCCQSSIYHCIDWSLSHHYLGNIVSVFTPPIQEEIKIRSTEYRLCILISSWIVLGGYIVDTVHPDSWRCT